MWTLLYITSQCISELEQTESKRELNGLILCETEPISKSRYLGYSIKCDVVGICINYKRTKREERKRSKAMSEKERCSREKIR